MVDDTLHIWLQNLPLALTHPAATLLGQVLSLDHRPPSVCHDWLGLLSVSI